MHERGLAYRAPGVVNWCPQDATVLANEQVVDGRCDRCGTAVESRELTQWYLRITQYADRLIDDMTLLEGALAAARADDAAELDRPHDARRRVHDVPAARLAGLAAALLGRADPDRALPGLR